MNNENTNESEINHILNLDESHGRKKWKKRLILMALLAVVFLGGMILWTRHQVSNGMAYKTQEAKRGDILVTVTATGTLKPRNQVEISSELSGIVDAVFVDYNSQVKIGQALATLDKSKLNAQVLESKAALETARARVIQAEATFKDAQKTLARLKNVWDISGGKIPAQNDMDTAEATFDRAKADLSSTRAAVSQAKATLESRETDLEKSTIRSPINGIVLSRSVEPGQTVAASLQAPILFTLAEDLTQMDLLVNVDEADVGQVQEGQKARFTVDAYPQRVFAADIYQVRFGATTSSGVVTYETVLHVDNSDLLLRPGMTATADIIVKHIQNALLVPNAALRFAPPSLMQKGAANRGNLIDSLLPGPRRRRFASSQSGRNGQSGSFSTSNGRSSSNAAQHLKRVWLLKDGTPVPIPIRIGETDGAVTEVLDGKITTGMPLIVDMVKEGIQ